MIPVLHDGMFPSILCSRLTRFSFRLLSLLFAFIIPAHSEGKNAKPPSPMKRTSSPHMSNDSAVKPSGAGGPPRKAGIPPKDSSGKPSGAGGPPRKAGGPPTGMGDWESNRSVTMIRIDSFNASKCMCRQLT